MKSKLIRILPASEVGGEVGIQVYEQKRLVEDGGLRYFETWKIRKDRETGAIISETYIGRKQVFTD